MTIQRYFLENFYGQSDMSESVDGDYYKRDDIKHLIEWKTLTEKCKPLENERVIIAIGSNTLGYAEIMHWCIGLSSGEVEWHADNDDRNYPFPENAKWKPFDVPWNKS